MGKSELLKLSSVLGLIYNPDTSAAYDGIEGGREGEGGG